MKLSIILATHGRARWLDRCVRSLFASAALEPGLELELIVGVNGRDPESESVLGELKAVHPVVHWQELEPVSPAAARNKLLRSASGDWVQFIDDDAYVEPSFYGEFLRAVGSFADASVIGGPNLTPPGSTLFQAATGLALSSRFATFLSRPRYRPDGRARSCTEEELILCNLFVRSTALQSLGAEPFPESFVCNEENWLLQTLSARGYRLVYVPAFQVWHERRPTALTLIRQVFKYGCGRGQNILHRPRTIRPAHVIPSLCVLYALIAPLAVAARPPAPDSLQAWAWPFVAYFVLCGAFALHRIFRTGAPLRLFAFTAVVFPMIHLFYGLGVLHGLWRANDKG